MTTYEHVDEWIHYWIEKQKCVPDGGDRVLLMPAEKVEVNTQIIEYVIEIVNTIRDLTAEEYRAVDDQSASHLVSYAVILKIFPIGA